MRRLIITLLAFMVGTTTGAMAYDIDVFDECSVAIKPNVLFLMDTSLSMRRQDVIDNGIENYDSEGAFIINRDASDRLIAVDSDGNILDRDDDGNLPSGCRTWQIQRDTGNNDPKEGCAYKASYRDRGYQGSDFGFHAWPIDYREPDYEDNIFYWLVTNKTTGAGDWHLFYPLNILKIHEVKNEDVVESFLRFGIFQGDIDQDGEIENTDESNLYATGDYVHYLKYVEDAQKDIDWGDVDSSEPYDPAVNYRAYYGYDSNSQPLGYGEYITDKVYVRMAGDIRPFNSIRNILNPKPDGIYINDPHSTDRQIITCGAAKTNLVSQGWTRTKVWEAFGCDCGGAITYTLMTGNFLNYLDKKKSRRYNAIDAIWSVVSNRPNDARYGIMQFDLGIFSTFFDLSHWRSQGADLAAPCGSSEDTIQRILFGKYNHDSRTSIPEYGQPLYFGHPSDISKETPLAEALIEAGCYLVGSASWFNTDADAFDPTFFDSTHSGSGSTSSFVYKSPIQCKDQKNHIIILTDGAPKDDFEVFDGLITNKGRGVSWEWITDKNFDCYNPVTNDPLSTTIGNYYVPTPPEVDNDVTMVFDTQLNVNYHQQWLDDVAAFLYDKDMSSKDNDEGRQNIRTHAMGFVVGANTGSVDRPLMTQTAVNGHGHYMFTSTKQGLIDELNTILDTVMEDFSFSSAATPVSQSDMIYTGNDIYMSSFVLEAGARGRGNVLKFLRDGTLVKGRGDNLLFNSSGGVNSGTRDWWYPDPGSDPTGNSDEDPMAVHGLARKLYDQINETLSLGTTPTALEIINAVKTKRNIYLPYQSSGAWNLGSIADLAIAGAITIPMEDGNNYSDDELYRFLSGKIYGLGYKWPFGDIIHSNIQVAQYPDPDDTSRDYGVSSYIYVGTNAGMIHCFDATTGEEKWAIVYPDFKDRLHELESFFDDEEHWFADGYITLFYDHVDYNSNGQVVTDGIGVDYTVRNPKYLIAGERRGGSSYHIIDISDVANPSYVAQVGGSGDWGQSWSKPQLCRVKNANNNGDTDEGFLVTGGYDKNQDLQTPGTGTKGKFLALYDMDGTAIHTFVGGVASIVSARIIDHDHDSGRIFSRIYSGDLKGNVFHASDDMAANGSPRTPDGSWPLQHQLFSGPSFPVTVNGTPGTLYQKLFYAPVAGTACSQDRVFFGTGDREHPLFSDPAFNDGVYSVPDSWSKTYSQADLTEFVLDASSITETDSAGGVKQEIYSSITEIVPANLSTCESSCEADNRDCLKACGDGWFFNFVREGEKMISEPLVTDGILIFGTYTPPTITITSDVCNAGGTCVPGKGRVYVVSTCEDSFAVKSYKLVNNPMPQPSFIFDKNTGKALVSTGDGQIVDPDLPVVVPDYWKHSGAAL